MHLPKLPFDAYSCVKAPASMSLGMLQHKQHSNLVTHQPMTTLNNFHFNPAGMSLGMVQQLPSQDDETSVSRRQLLAKLDVCMGGRVAEELIFGESNVTTGGAAVCWLGSWLCLS